MTGRWFRGAHRLWPAGASVLATSALGAALAGQTQAPAPFPGMLGEHPVIDYRGTPPRDVVATVNDALAAGSRTLGHDSRTGYLPAVLDALGISSASQLLVFSKTGLQRAHTGPRTPRALYFNEAVVVGYVPGASALEVAALDPTQGVVFYTLEQGPSVRPAFTRQTSCLTCHVSSATLGVPGYLVRSHLVDATGALVPHEPVVAVNHTTPHPQRWGGWFVTSEEAPPPYQLLGHLGNVTAAPHPSGGPPILSNRVMVEWLDGDAGAAGYLSRKSDHAALMVFDHQTYAANLLTRLGWEARLAAARGDASSAEVAARVRELADYLLFVGEAESSVEVSPPPGFVEHLRSRLPVDHRGRSLADLAIVPRSALATDLAPAEPLFVHACSFMVYSPAFEGLPAAVKTAVYRRLFAVLLGQVTGPRYAHLTAPRRQAVREILLDTRADIPVDLRTPRPGAQ